MDVTQKRWKEICEAILISESIEEFQFNTWIDPISRVEFRGNTLYIWAPSPIAINTLRKNYAAIIKEAVFKVMKREYDIEIVNPLDDSIPTEEDKARSLEPKKEYNLNPKYNFRTFQTF